MENIDSISSDKIIYNDNDKRCAPGEFFENGSCYDIKTIILIVHKYNENNVNNKIPLFNGSEMIDSNRYKKYLMFQLKEKLTKCKNQACWLTQPFLKGIQLEGKIRPRGPDGRFEWLSNNNIDQILHQYEQKYPEFMFLGAVPIDYDSKLLPKGYLDIDIVNLDYHDLLKKGKYKFGIVFNLDAHDESGSHWVALYYDLKKGQIYFFDSYGEIPDEGIQRQIRRIGRFMQNELGIKKPDNRYNNLRHQFEGSECGVYSVNFILRMIKGVSFDDVTTKRVPDRLVNQCRNIYFRNTNIKDPNYKIKNTESPSYKLKK